MLAVAIRILKWIIGFAFIAVLVAAIGIYAILPSDRPSQNMNALRAQASDAMLTALRATKRPRPLIAILAANEGTETTDFLVPYGVLKGSGVADVMAVSIRSGPVILMPALRIEADITQADFDRKFQDGADYVIVPAMPNESDPALLAWITSQAKKGAIIVSICAGAFTVAKTGLMDGHIVATHWYRRPELVRSRPNITSPDNQRYVVDRAIASSTGITASMPISLALVASIAGRETANAVAQDMGVDYWGPTHDRAPFQVTQGDAFTLVLNTLRFWQQDRIGIAVSDGIDEVTLGLIADAYSRTRLSRAYSVSPNKNEVVVTKNGLRLIADVVDGQSQIDEMLPDIALVMPGQAVDSALSDIARRYGTHSADFIRLEMEYPFERP